MPVTAASPGSGPPRTSTSHLPTPGTPATHRHGSDGGDGGGGGGAASPGTSGGDSEEQVEELPKERRRRNRREARVGARGGAPKAHGEARRAMGTWDPMVHELPQSPFQWFTPPPGGGGNNPPSASSHASSLGLHDRAASDTPRASRW